MIIEENRNDGLRENKENEGEARNGEV